MQHFIIAYKLQGGTQKKLFLKSTFCQNAAAVGAFWREPWTAPREIQAQSCQLLRLYRFRVLDILFSLWHPWILCQSPLATYEVQQGNISIKGNFYFLTNHFEQNQAGSRKKNLRKHTYLKITQTWEYFKMFFLLRNFASMCQSSLLKLITLNISLLKIFYWNVTYRKVHINVQLNECIHTYTPVKLALRSNKRTFPIS